MPTYLIPCEYHRSSYSSCIPKRIRQEVRHTIEWDAKQDLTALQKYEFLIHDLKEQLANDYGAGNMFVLSFANLDTVMAAGGEQTYLIPFEFIFGSHSVRYVETRYTVNWTEEQQQWTSLQKYEFIVNDIKSNMVQQHGSGDMCVISIANLSTVL